MKMSNKMNSSLIVSIALMIAISVSCGEEDTKEDSKKEKNQQENKRGLVLSEDYSAYEKSAEEAPSYKIKKGDSLIFNLSEYKFDLPDPDFKYIDEGTKVNKLRFTKSQFGYIDIMKGDELLSRLKAIVNMTEVGDIMTLENDDIIYLKGATEMMAEAEGDQFKLVFGFFIDNGKGHTPFDVFYVELID